MVSDAFVFHQGTKIHGVSVARDPEMEERWSHVKVPLVDVLPILAGEVLPDERFVVGGRLVTQDAVKIIGFDFEADTWAASLTTRPIWPLLLEITVGIHARRMTFRTVAPDGVTCETDVPFMLTHKGDATRLISVGTIPAKALAEGFVFEVPEAVENLRDIDVWVPSFRMAKVWQGLEEEAESATPLPGGPDLMLAVPGDATEPCLRIAQERRTLVLRLVEGGGPRYRRTPPPTLTVMLCPPGDPSVVLAGWQVSLDDLLRDGVASVPLPKRTKDTDVMVSRIWTKVVRA